MSGTRIGSHRRNAMIGRHRPPAPPGPPPTIRATPSGVPTVAYAIAYPDKVVFGSTNRVGTDMRYKKQRGQPLEFTDASLRHNLGTCAALSALWLANMFSFVDPSVTAPNTGRAAVMFAKNWRANLDADPMNLGNIDDAGLQKVQRHDYGDLYSMLDDIAVYGDASYYIDLQQGHIIAAVKRAGHVFLYDSNLALWRFGVTEFAGCATQLLCDFGWQDAHACWAYEVVPES